MAANARCTHDATRAGSTYGHRHRHRKTRLTRIRPHHPNFRASLRHLQKILLMFRENLSSPLPLWIPNHRSRSLRRRASARYSRDHRSAR